MAPIRGSDQKKLSPEGKGRLGVGMSGISCVGGVGRSQTGRGREFQAEEGASCLKARRSGGGVGLGN